ncbi:hypothetical protein TanjilG_02923 [Lupinus angustifolius]|uniref:Pentatricopeptide repeat-containing protein n=1 Tax=Lupinus angustifolius TaxID=3871 RepID=A0A1J7GA25_LUPAN|nr:PREDICTED: pentatricopeptide repeat-containing protein At5g66520-like [Lupinus angustifolius]OIV97215.1 hypothetical protein TanjilG_02923 [Lupinus angustifolius]
MSSIPYTYSPILRLLQGCFNLTTKLVKQIHAHAITHDLSRFSYVSSRILAFYSQSPRNDLRYAETLFTHISNPNVFDCNSMIMGFSKNSQCHKSFFVFKQMLNNGVRPNSCTVTVLVKACLSLSLLEQVHTQIIKLGTLSDVYVVSSVVSVYSKYGAIRVARQVFDESSNKNVVCWTSIITGYCSNGLVIEARELFDSIPERNGVSYSAMVSGYVRNGCYNEGIEVFRELKSCANVKPNSSLLASVLNACAAVGAFEEGKWIHSYIDENGFEYELELGTALIDFYAKCGWVGPSEKIFDSMRSKDVTTWSAMIMGLAINGKNKMALDLFAKMEKVGLKPNAVTFVGVLTACNHKYLLSEAWWLFGHMSKTYGITPSIEHYGCMVDILARGGKIGETLSFINSMPIAPDGAIWGSLLNGCLMHGHIELGQKVGKYLIEFEPRHSGRYILLANMYASMGRWEGVSETRKLMKDRGVPVISAWSFIEIDQNIHKFVVDDKSRSYSREIYEILSRLGKELNDFSIEKDVFLF